MTADGTTSDGPLLDRFVAGREEAAFAELVRRHGPMVLGTCRRVLGNAADADDAFQAVFLVLVRRAGGLRGRATVGDFLYGVAVRTALKARAAAMKRRAKEAVAAARTPPRPDATAAETTEAVDAELGRLPALYREPLVLCELQQLPRKTVAERLGIPEGTLSSRLAAARKMLADRLARRGLALPAAGLAAVAVPSALQAATIHTASVAAGHAAGTVPAAVAELSARTLPEWLLANLPALLAALGLTATAATVAVVSIPPSPPPPVPVVAVVGSAADRFIPYGDSADRVVTRTADGFHFKLPATTREGHLGVRWDGVWAGDFQVDAAYELIAVPDTVTTRYGAGLGLAVFAGDAVNTGGWVVRGTFVNEGPGYHVARSWLTPAGPVYPYALVPGGPKTGRVGLRRVGGELIHLTADRPDGELRVMYRAPYPDRPVADVMLFADTGGAPAAVEGRLYDLKARFATDLPPLPPGPPTAGVLSDSVAGPTVVASPATAPVRSWVVVRAGLTFVVGVVGGFALARRRRF